MKNLDFLKSDQAIAALSSLGLLFSFVLLFTACDTTQTTTTVPALNVDTTIVTPPANEH